MNKKIHLTALFVAVMCTGVLAGEPQGKPKAVDEVYDRLFTGSFSTGYSGGVSFTMSGTFANFAQDFPFRVRLGLECVKFDPGDAWKARRVFINNATNGTARDHGTIWAGRLDVLYPINFFSFKRVFVYGGPRYSDFRGYFEYIGGAETFDVFTQQWGIGGGLETSFPISPRVDLTLSLGSDYFFRNTIDGHDTYYRPNGDDTHPIDNYTYKDADDAINQPEVEIRSMFGVAYHF